MATSSAAHVSKVSLKLLVDTKEKRVLFAEAGKDFVDFLFNLLHLPVGTVVRLLTGKNMVGTLGNLYKSIQNMNETYFQPNHTKDSVLKPKAPLSATPVSLLSLAGGTSSALKTCYICPNSIQQDTEYEEDEDEDSDGLHPYFSDNANAVCPDCNTGMSTVLNYVEAPNEVAKVEEGGFVKGMVTYMVMDDLEVTPMSTISGITMLNKFNVEEVDALEERVVDFGMSEGLKLLEASLHSKKVLTTVFLGIACSGLKSRPGNFDTTRKHDPNTTRK